MTEPHPRGYVFRLNDHGQGPELLTQVMLERGWIEFDEDEQNEWDWNIWWRTSRFRNSDYEDLMPWQRVNHYPKTTGITKKDCLARNLKRMRGVYGPVVFNFSPLAFNLPNDYTKFVAEYTKLREKEQGKQIFWICKPADLSRGRGIFIFRDLSELQYDCNAVVQCYISNPMLISGYKFDLRIYVAVSSFHPLNIYIYQEGIVRFSTEKFDLSVLKNLYAHLTNTSINKHSPSYGHEKERVGPGCKWTITQFRHYLHQNHIDDSSLWSRITIIIILTVLTQAPQVPKVNNCFELYGFDVIIDENLKPWLLEVNFSPALSSDCQTDVIVKKPMLHDLFDMLCFKEEDMERGGPNTKEKKMARVYGTTPTGRMSKQSRSSTYHKLPDIARAATTSSITQNSRSATVIEAEEPEPPAVVPGCGLPSVQQELIPISSKHSTPSSRRSSYESQQPNILRHNSSSYSLRRSDSSVSGLSGKVPFNKKLSKSSMYSDSGYSGSDSSDMLSLTDESVSHNGRASAMRYPVNTRRKSKIVARHVDKPGQSEQENGELHSNDLKSPSKQGEQYATGIPPLSHNTQDEMEEDEDMDDLMNTPKQSPPPRGPSRANSRAHTKGTTYKRKVSVSYTSNPIMSRSMVHTSRTTSHSRSSPRHGGNYMLSWRNRASRADSRTNKAPQPSFGDFRLAFPFSEMTRKAAVNNLDARVVIRECQRLLKSKHVDKHTDRSGKKVYTHNNHGNGAHTGKTGMAREKVMDIEHVWGPLRLPTDQVTEQ